MFMHKFLHGHMLSLLTDIYPGAYWLEHMEGIYFNFFWNNQNVFHRGSTSLYFHQKCVSAFPWPWQHLVWSMFLMLVILIDVQWLLICVFLMTNDVEHLLMQLFSGYTDIPTFQKFALWHFTFIKDLHEYRQSLTYNG